MCMDDPKLRPYSAGAKYHHEALNGSGYPDGLTRKNIPLEGQIIRVADEFDAIVSKRQYKSHIGITDTLKILVEEAQPLVPKTVALKTLQEDTDLGKLNPRIVRALCKVVIEDTEYEISCIFDYLKYIQNQIDRLEQISKYNLKREKAKSAKKKSYFEEGMKMLFEGGEDFRNYKYVLEEYRVAHLKKKEQIDKLFNEIKIIKQIRI